MQTQENERTTKRVYKSFFNAERDALLKHMREVEKLTLEECAARFRDDGLSISPYSLGQRCLTLGYKRPELPWSKQRKDPFWTAEKIMELRELHAVSPEISYEDIGKKLGATGSAVSGKCGRLGLFRKSATKPSSLVAIDDADEEPPLIGRKPEPAPFPKPVSFVRSGVQIADLKESMCHWPIGDPLEEGFHFCGARKHFGVPYCEHHAAIAYNPAASRRRAA